MDGSLSAGRLPDATLQSPRAQRFPLEMPVWFRQAGSEGWVEGRTVNVSQSGVLFSTTHPAPDEDFEIELTLEMSCLGPLFANITCRARAVRIERMPTGGTLVGARIDSYQFLPRRRTSPTVRGPSPDGRRT